MAKYEDRNSNFVFHFELSLSFSTVILMAFCLLFPVISRWLLFLQWLPAPVIPAPALIITFWWRLAWIVCGFATISGHYIHDALIWGFFPCSFWMFVHPLTQLVLNTHYKFLCSPCEESWWFGLVVAKQVLPAVPESLPWWHIVAVPTKVLYFKTAVTCFGSCEVLSALKKLLLKCHLFRIR